MKVIDCIQGTDEWFEARLGKVSASNFSSVLAGGAGKTRNAYMRKLVAEVLTGLPQATYSNEAMLRGIETEAEAREYYATLNNCEVVQVGFCELNENVGCSPDGLVGDDGLLEIKCPDTTTHIETILKDKMQTTYIPQVQGQIWVTGRKWCDYVSYDPRMKVKKFFCKRIERDEKYIMVLEVGINQFVIELKAMIEKLTVNPF